MERQKIEALFKRLKKQKARPFPKAGQPIDAPKTHGVYVIRDRARNVVHVGRTVRGRSGLRQCLNNHLSGNSSFADVYLKRKGSLLRKGYSFQYLEVLDDRLRALLECLAAAWYCPAH